MSVGQQLDHQQDQTTRPTKGLKVGNLASFEFLLLFFKLIFFFSVSFHFDYFPFDFDFLFFWV
jgi:hypothetical protein